MLLEYLGADVGAERAPTTGPPSGCPWLLKDWTQCTVFREPLSPWGGCSPGGVWILLGPSGLQKPIGEGSPKVTTVRTDAAAQHHRGSGGKSV